MIFINFRTDLAIERREISPHTDDGLIINETTKNGAKITSIEVINKRGERAIRANTLRLKRTILIAVQLLIRI